MKSILFLYDFISQTCQIKSEIVETLGNSIQVVCLNNDTKISDKIVSLYDLYGCDCVKYINETFSLYDRSKQQLLICRDKLGIQQLYYAQLPTGIVFSDSLKEILQYVKRPQIRAHELAQPIRHNYPIDLQNTWIEQVKRLRAGEYAVVDKDGLRLRTYWKRNHNTTFKGTKQDAIAETQRIIRESVKRCMQTDEPVAVLLSGGIDSTTLALFAKECQKEVHVISAGYKGQYACDERQIASRFAKEHNLIYHEVELSGEDFQDLFDEYIQYIDEPCFDVSSMSQFALYKKAAAMGFKVILSGLGGDELFYSYKDDNAKVRALKLRREFDSCFPLKKKWRKYIKFMLKNWKYVLLANNPLLEDDKLPIAWTYNDYEKFSKTASLEYDSDLIKFDEIEVQPQFSYKSGLDEVYDHKFSTFANQLCVYLGNKLGKAAGVELRYPLLDAELVEFLDTLPIDMKFKPEISKYFQKEVMKGLLPDYILYARKRGFEPPFDFIWEICKQYKYQFINADHVFFNSMMADKLFLQYLRK